MITAVENLISFILSDSCDLKVRRVVEGEREKGRKWAKRMADFEKEGGGEGGEGKGEGRVEWEGLWRGWGRRKRQQHQHQQQQQSQKGSPFGGVFGVPLSMVVRCSSLSSPPIPSIIIICCRLFSLFLQYGGERGEGEGEEEEEERDGGGGWRVGEKELLKDFGVLFGGVMGREWNCPPLEAVREMGGKVVGERGRREGEGEGGGGGGEKGGGLCCASSLLLLSFYISCLPGGLLGEEEQERLGGGEEGGEGEGEVRVARAVVLLGGVEVCLFNVLKYLVSFLKGFFYYLFFLFFCFSLFIIFSFLISFNNNQP